jgi:O-acetyl-ADP-ribose deacetylase (regulator of RNase III)
MIGERARVRTGTVLVTESGMLRTSHHVRRIFHVAAVEGGLGRGVKADPEELKLCVKNVLSRADKENRKLWRRLCKTSLDSILIPMMGTGEGGVPIEMVAEKIIPTAIDYIRTTPDTTLKHIYFLAFKLRDKSACDNVLEYWRKHGVLERLGN